MIYIRNVMWNFKLYSRIYFDHLYKNPATSSQSKFAKSIIYKSRQLCILPFGLIGALTANKYVFIESSV